MANYCKTCGVEVHPKRVAMGYPNTCPEHSTATKYAGFVVAEGKTDYMINVVRDPETAKHMERLMTNRGQSA
jgi:hypothetical protein